MHITHTYANKTVNTIHKAWRRERAREREREKR